MIQSPCGSSSRRSCSRDGLEPPGRLVHEDIVATMLGRDDLDDDVRGINASLELIRRTRGGGWPEEPVTPEFNLVDLVWHESSSARAFSFSYVLRDSEGDYLGCAYLYPMGRRTELSEALVDHDVDVSWWVTPTPTTRATTRRAFDALRRWVTEDFPFIDPYYSNREIPGSSG